MKKHDERKNKMSQHMSEKNIYEINLINEMNIILNQNIINNIEFNDLKNNNLNFIHIDEKKKLNTRDELFFKYRISKIIFFIIKNS